MGSFCSEHDRVPGTPTWSSGDTYLLSRVIPGHSVTVPGIPTAPTTPEVTEQTPDAFGRAEMPDDIDERERILKELPPVIDTHALTGVVLLTPFKLRLSCFAGTALTPALTGGELPLS